MEPGRSQVDDSMSQKGGAKSLRPRGHRLPNLWIPWLCGHDFLLGPNACYLFAMALPGVWIVGWNVVS